MMALQTDQVLESIEAVSPTHVHTNTSHERCNRCQAQSYITYYSFRNETRPGEQIKCRIGYVRRRCAYLASEPLTAVLPYMYEALLEDAHLNYE